MAAVVTYTAMTQQRARRRWWPGGPLAGLAVAVVIVGVCLVLEGMLFSRGGSIQLFIDAKRPAPALMTCLLAASAGVAAGIVPSDRTQCPMSRRAVLNAVVIGGFLTVLVPLAIVTLADDYDPGNVGLFVLTAELTLAAGATTGLASQRWPRLGAAIASATVAFLFYLAAHNVVITAVRVDEVFSYDGLTPQGQQFLNFLAFWRPILMAAVTALTVALTGRLLARGPGRFAWLAAAAAAPLLLRAIGFGLGTVPASTETLTTIPARFWLLLTAGCLAGFALAAIAPPARRAR